MSAAMHEPIDAWRAAAAGRIYEGTVDLARLKRLLPSLTGDSGSCSYRIEFYRDASGQASARVTASTELPLLCQRSLEPFAFTVEIEQTLGLIRNEQDEAALLPEVEPLLVPENGMISPLDLLEDELILAVPAVPVSEEVEPVVRQFGSADVEQEETVNPFAQLASLKRSSS